jgi:hypothetical protein
MQLSRRFGDTINHNNVLRAFQCYLIHPFIATWQFCLPIPQIKPSYLMLHSVDISGLHTLLRIDVHSIWLHGNHEKSEKSHGSIIIVMNVL